VQNAIRDLLIKMNIRLVGTKKYKKRSTCCGDVYYGSMPTRKVEELMIEKALEMPVDDIVVHCVSCIVAVSNGHRKPQYMADLLMNEETAIKSLDLDKWHKELSDYINTH